MRIQNNVPALNAHRFYGINQAGVTKSIAKLSSGYRINSAADDAAGLAISEKMRAQIRGLTMASKNTQDGISLIQTAEGGMQEIDNMLQRIRELVVYASNDTQDQASATATDGDRRKIQDEIDALVEEIDSMSERVEFNKKKIINGSFNGHNATSPVIGELRNATAKYYGAKSDLNDVKNLVSANEDTVNNAITSISDLLGAIAADVTLMENQGTAVSSFMTSLTAALTSLGNVTTSLSAIDVGVGTVAGSTSVAVTGDIEDYVASITANVTTALTFLSSVDEVANSLQKRINDNVDLVTNKLTALGSALDTLNTTNIGNRAALGSATTAMGNAAADLEEAQAAYDEDESGPKLYFQIGANANQGISVAIESVKSDALGIGDGKGKTNANLNVMKITGEDITLQLDVLDRALSYVTTQRSKLGAVQNRLEFTKSSLDVSAENLTEAESRIRDIDMAKEMTQFTKMNILFQASTAMLAQANALPQGVLQMLG
jgi:flagellin